MRKATLFHTLVVLTLAATPALLVDCGDGGGGGGSGKVANIKPGNMPDGANWDGVYFNNQYGNLHLVKTGDTIAGKWKRANGSAWGELNGKVEGNVLRFEWTEHKIGMVGPGANTSGKGYFVYSRPAGDNVDDDLKGEWGLGDSEAGNSWDNVKQRDMKPDPKSIGGSQADHPAVGDWK